MNDDIHDVVYVSNEQIHALPWQVRLALFKTPVGFQYKDRVRGGMLYQAVPRSMAQKHNMWVDPALTEEARAKP